MKRSARAPLPEELRGHECADDRQHDLHRLAAAQLRLAARALGHVDRHLLEAEARVDDADQRLDLRRAVVNGSREQRQSLRVDGVETARRVAERPPQDERHRAPQERGAEPARALGR